MIIKEIINKYIQQGHSKVNARNLAAQEIILTKIASSDLCDYITLKGGIVMFNLTKNNRRVTQDIDFDLISYSIDDNSIKLFIKKLDAIHDEISVILDGPILKLHQEDYQGVRIDIILKDSLNDKLKIKLDIGVHTYSNITQSKLMFSFAENEKHFIFNVNPPNQIFAEKLLSLGRLGDKTTRYKDIYDLFFLINNKLLEISDVKKILNAFFNKSLRNPKNIKDLVKRVLEALNNDKFSKDVMNRLINWTVFSYETIKHTIIDYILLLL